MKRSSHASEPAGAYTGHVSAHPEPFWSFRDLRQPSYPTKGAHGEMKRRTSVSLSSTLLTSSSYAHGHCPAKLLMHYVQWGTSVRHDELPQLLRIRSE